MTARSRRVAHTDDPVRDIGAFWSTLQQAEREWIVAHLTRRDVDAIERARAVVDRVGWRATPLSMGIRLGGLRMLPHAEYLSQKFVDAFEGSSPRQIWNLPPRHGKSLLASRWGAIWALDRDPTINLALTSYGDQLANENSTFVRDKLVEHSDMLETQLRRDRRRSDRFVTTHGGGLIAASVGSSLTGFGANGIVIDDPFKNWEEAHSEAHRRKVWDWWRSTVRSRLEERPGRPGWVIVVMTRWHEDDLTGRLLQEMEDGGTEWELVRLPAIAEAPHPTATEAWLRISDALGRKEGEALAPELFDIDALRARARDFGAYLTAGLEQQRPSPEEGSDILRSWFRYYSEQPSEYDSTLSSWDMKLKDKEAGDYVVGQAWGRTGADFWCFDQMRGQWSQPITIAAIALMAVRHPNVKKHVVENTGFGPEVLASLRDKHPGYTLSPDTRSALGIADSEVERVTVAIRRGIPGIVPENPKGDKRVRMRAQTPLIEAGNVHLPEGAHFTALLVDEAAAFPNGAHDDQIDAMSQALKHLQAAQRRELISVVGPAGVTQPSYFKQ